MSGPRALTCYDTSLKTPRLSSKGLADLQICGGLLLFLARLVNVTGLSSTMGAHFGSKRGQCVYLSARVLTPPCPSRLLTRD